MTKSDITLALIVDALGRNGPLTSIKIVEHIYAHPARIISAYNESNYREIHRGLHRAMMEGLVELGKAKLPRGGVKKVLELMRDPDRLSGVDIRPGKYKLTKFGNLASTFLYMRLQ